MMPSLQTMGPLDIRHFGSSFSGGDLVFGYVDGREWIVPHDMSYCLLDGRVSTVRAGFHFDFASVPRVFWRLVPPAGLKRNPYGLAAVWHDWLYQHQAIGGRSITRAEADNVMLEIMFYIGVNGRLATTIYRAVRAGGWLPWWRAGRRLKRNQEERA